MSKSRILKSLISRPFMDRSPQQKIPPHCLSSNTLHQCITYTRDVRRVGNLRPAVCTKLHTPANEPSWAFVGRGRGIQSDAIKRRSRCGFVRGCPVLSSHFSPGPALHVGQ